MSADRILSQLLGSSAASGFAGGLAGSLAGGMLTSKRGRKFGKKALQVGGIAAVGGLAYAAWQRHRAGEASGVPASEPAVASLPVSPGIDRFVPATADGPDAENLGLTLLRAMIAAAQADGRLDAVEREALHARVRSLDLTDAEKLDLLGVLDRPVDLNELVRAARTPEIASEIYAVSLLAIEIDTPEERAYLELLAARLGLPKALVASIHEELDTEAAEPLARAAS